jgi:hypothetical protein
LHLRGQGFGYTFKHNGRFSAADLAVERRRLGPE